MKKKHLLVSTKTKLPLNTDYSHKTPWNQTREISRVRPMQLKAERTVQSFIQYVVKETKPCCPQLFPPDQFHFIILLLGCIWCRQKVRSAKHENQRKTTKTNKHSQEKRHGSVENIINTMYTSADMIADCKLTADHISLHIPLSWSDSGLSVCVIYMFFLCLAWLFM